VWQRPFSEKTYPSETLDKIVCDTLSFDAPLVHLHDDIYTVELFHGPTLAFKDVGARFMARLLSYFIRRRGRRKSTCLWPRRATRAAPWPTVSLSVEGIHVYVLYPKGKVSKIQESSSPPSAQHHRPRAIDGYCSTIARLSSRMPSWTATSTAT
jgi:threonine synthase